MITAMEKNKITTIKKYDYSDLKMRLCDEIR